MNKILIVGHPQSGYAEVETLLQACGMAGAQPSRREGFTPGQISATLSKAHNVAPLQRLGHDNEVDVEQLVPGPVWHGMALDLMLGNLDQALWGWADPNAIHWLNYWRDLDPSLHFILVYDRPHSVLTRANGEDAAGLSPEALGEYTRNWAAYNAALLHFSHRNPHRCLLVHSEQVRASAASYLRQVRARIHAPWSERLEQLVAIDSDRETPRQMAAASPQTKAQAIPVIGNDEALVRFVSDALLQDQPQCMQLYEELQACANLPLAADEGSDRDAVMALGAWSAMATQRQQLLEQADLMQRLQSDNAQAQAVAAERQRQLDESQKLRAERERHHQHALADLTQTSEELGKAQAASQQENELLRGKLQQVQQELEHRQREVDLLVQRNAETSAQIQAATQQENELLLSQLLHLQEELERHHLEKQHLQQSSKPETTYLYGAGDRVRDELSYRVGAALVRCSKSLGGCLRLPWAASSVLRQYRRELPQRYAQALTPIEAYRDAHEAARVRNHLSYRLGEVYLKQTRTFLGRMRMPWALLREVRAFREARQSDSTA